MKIGKNGQDIPETEYEAIDILVNELLRLEEFTSKIDKVTKERITVAKRILSRKPLNNRIEKLTHAVFAYGSHDIYTCSLVNDGKRCTCGYNSEMKKLGFEV